MKYEELIKIIISGVGGEKNIKSVTHCMTRLRFNLVDDNLTDQELIKENDGVVNVLNKGGQFQVVIGTHVEDVYQELIDTTKLSSNSNEENQTKQNMISVFFDTIAGIFIPIVGALAGAGMLKAILSVATAMSWLSPDSQTYTILFMISDVVFYYLPFFIAISAAKKFKTSAFLALIFAGMLVHPTFVGLKDLGESVYFLGIPLRLATYSTSVVPIILIVFFQSYVEKYAKKISPNAVKTFLVPIITILITAPVGLIILGPVGAIAGDYLATFFNFLNERISWLVPTLVGGFFPLLVMTGMHYSVGAAQAVQRASVGYATILAPGALASNMAQAAAVLAVSVKSKNKSIKTLATSVGITAICGITEPALYGITLKYKRPLYATMLAGGIAGFYSGIMGVKAWSAGTSTIFALPIYIGEDNSFLHACISVAIALVLGFVFSFVFYKEESVELEHETEQNQTPHKEKKTIELNSPMKGKTISLDQVEDEAFSSLVMGKGVAIDPVDGVLVSPFDGKVTMLFKTKHALGIKSDEGVEILIHVGLDTVKLEGEYFETFVSENDRITKGQKLVSFDKSKINTAGYSCITPIIVTNSQDYLDVIETKNTNVTTNDLLLSIID
ncbi:beta-glucoside-specific PTS transporter subunit IIABC [Enterococcus sp.]|uniref:beta-glucoside-specific PTS transporter subunit IIABC n=1 Tax=Enterococcus sp. TaxID=35783 RepID=UPI00289B8B58|nr:beta-glucoside-specific PTS transporter subunit IIABC [Enterococcus sp.]